MAWPEIRQTLMHGVVFKCVLKRHAETDEVSTLEGLDWLAVRLGVEDSG